MWGSTSMVQNFLSDRSCWARHLSLNPKTGLDPSSIRLRSAQGFESADYLIGTYWVWARLIENLADVGYDGNTMFMASYDWRLSPKKLEERDSYFSKLKVSIELARRKTGEKACLVSHSMGSNMMIYFLQWVINPVNNGGGGGGKDWVSKHIKSHINIAGPLLGTPKALTSIFSGEMRDTAEMSPFETVLENYFGRSVRRNMFSTWGSLWSLMSKGGNGIWGDGDLVTFTNTTSGSSPFNVADAMEKMPRMPFSVGPKVDAMLLPSIVGTSGGSGDDSAAIGDDNVVQVADKLLTDFGDAEGRSATEFLRLLSEWGGGHGSRFGKFQGIGFDSDGGEFERKCQRASKWASR